MDDHAQPRQDRITAWFDQVYRRKGRRYLRPVKAYYIYLELLDLEAGKSLLDVACGLGHLLLAASEYGYRMSGVDISEVAVERARTQLPRAEIVRANAECLPYSDGQFNAVTCIGSLERMVDVRQVLAEMLRVGKKDARYCFLVRNSNTFSWKYLTGSPLTRDARGHQGANTEYAWRDLFESAGFRILQALPDQYPLHQKALWRGLHLRKVDFRRVMPSRRPLDRAYEFIFLLEKSN